MFLSRQDVAQEVGQTWVCTAHQLKTIHTVHRSHIPLKLCWSLFTLQHFVMLKQIGCVPKLLKLTFTKKLDCSNHQYYYGHWRKNRDRNFSELACLLVCFRGASSVLDFQQSGNWSALQEGNLWYLMHLFNTSIKKGPHDAYPIQKGVGLC